MAILPAAATCSLRSMNWCVVIELLVWLLICCVLIELLCGYWTNKNKYDEDGTNYNDDTLLMFWFILFLKASLRMDGHVSREQRIARVQEVMLQVTKHQKYRLLWRILKNSNDDNGVRIGPIGHFRVPLGLGFKTRVGAQPLIGKSFFILMQIKLIFSRKVVYLASFWKWGFLELGSGLFVSFHQPRNVIQKCHFVQA